LELKAKNKEDLAALRAELASTARPDLCQPCCEVAVPLGGSQGVEPGGAVVVLSVDGPHSDITSIQVDAVVNAANETLEGGGGVDQAIHAAAGPELRKACAALPLVRVGEKGGALDVGDLARCPVGQARSTPAFGLTSAKVIIHTVGPILGDSGEPQPLLLAACYSACLDEASRAGLESIAFCSISTGFYGYPQREACQVSLSAVVGWFKRHDFSGDTTSLRKVVFSAFSDASFELHKAELGKVAASSTGS
jgi:O-acetyl-ADP-ribose deacetylase (regulator of RNase III)